MNRLYDEDCIHYQVIASLGTTPSCAFDDIEEIGLVSNQNRIWLHVDAAYAGNLCLFCPEISLSPLSAFFTIRFGIYMR